MNVFLGMFIWGLEIIVIYDLKMEEFILNILILLVIKYWFGGCKVIEFNFEFLLILKELLYYMKYLYIYEWGILIIYCVFCIFIFLINSG